MRSTLLPFALAAAFTAGACGGPAPQEESARQSGMGRPPAAQLAALKVQAEAACRCDRAAGTNESQACWGAFNRAIEPYEIIDGTMMCGPSSSSWVCFDQNAQGLPDENCVFRSRAYGACSAEEERWLKANPPDEGPGGCGP